MKWIYLVLMFLPLVQLEYSNFTETENLINSPCTDQNHLLLVPGVLTAGGTNRACVSRFFPEGPARLLLTLFTDDEQTITAERELPPGDGGCVDIAVPLLPNTKADLVTSVKYPEAKCSWERRVTLRISSGRVVAVHTERAKYRPGETLRARVFALKADLTPAHGTIEEIWIEGPPGAWEGTRVAQWTRVRSKMGLAQVQHEIDELAPPGKWTVRARLGDGSQGSATFWVGNYDLPPFQLSVRHAPRVLRTSERLVWTVCVRYPWAEAVEGMLVIRLRGAGAGSSSPGVRTAVRLRAPRACHRHAAASRRVGLNGEQPPSVVVADFSFQEEGTRIWQNTTVVSQVVDKPVSLEFVTKDRTVVTPGLPYKVKVRATRWDEKPASNERIKVCRYPSLGEQAAETNKPTCNSGDTDSSGVARVMFAAEDDGSPFYRFESNLSNDTSIRTASLTLATRRSKTQAALGPLRADSRGSRTFVPLYLNLHNVTTPVTVHFVVIIRGGIIYRWGATTQCPIGSSTNHVQIAARNSRCNEAMALTDDINRKVDKSNANYDSISDYFNKIVNRQRSKSQNRNNESYNKNQNEKNNNSNRNKNQNKNFNDYYSRYMSQMNKSYNNIDTNKNQDRNDINYHINADSFNKDTNLNDRSSEAKEKSPNHVNFEDVNTSDALLERHLLRVMLPIKVTQQMCPDSHLIAYFYHNGEFVSASKHFEMDDCFVNKVDLTWLSRQALPGSTTALQIATPGPALCALTVLDSAAKSTTVTTVKDVLIDGLKKMMDAHRNLTEYDTAGDCFLNVESPEMPSNSLELTASWLAAAGVRTVGDMPLRRQCNPAAMTEEGTVPRSDFSEAWLWRLVTVGANGSMMTTAKAPDSITRFEANAVCLTKTGVSVAQPAILQVFREFFIHADGPRRLRRGDNTVIRYRLFNYLYEPLSVQIQIFTDPHLQGPSDFVESVCIPPRASTARRGEITASGEGEGRVIIRAKAVNDGGCGNKTNGRGVSDEVVIRITVEPEGVPVHEQKSTLLCGKDTRNSIIASKSQVFWSWPKVETVPGTESLTVWAIGNITGPLLSDADSLVLLPRGCGEQNMARLATNLLSLSHLHPTSAAAATAREHVARGFNRQLQYIHPSGGFSAFGPSDSSASTWLTAFSLRYLKRAHQMLWPGLPIPPAIDRAERWLLNQHMENGCFRNEGQVFHRELRGGLNEEGEIASVALTAYVITSLIESTSPLPNRIITNTLSCLRALPPIKYQTPTRIYAHSLLAYAFMRLKRYEEEIRRSNEAGWIESLKENEGLVEVMELVKMGRKGGEFLWWETNSLSTSVEATSYALLALKESPSALHEFGAGAVRWLAAHRTASGGFVSTQDTLVALEALSAWSSLQDVPANLTVTAVSGTKTSRTVDLQAGMMIPEIIKMDGDSVKIKVEGTGCALIQATRSYNTLLPDEAENKRLSVQLAVHTDGEFDCDGNGNCFCAAVVEACVVWSGLFPEMALLEVSLPGGYEADAKRLYSQLHQPESLLRRIELSASSSRATFYLTGRPVAPRHACVSVHAVGPRSGTKPAHVRVMDYYRPSVNDTQIYTIPEDCPTRIAHDTSQELKDNIFNKARSLSDSSEILINHDYDFEDIPEGIPLEDPLYENLTSRKDKDDVRKVETANDSTTINNAHHDSNRTIKDSNDINKFNIVSKKSKTANENIKITAHDNETKPTEGSNVVVIDDKLDLGEEEKNVQNEHEIIIINSENISTLSVNKVLTGKIETQRNEEEVIKSAQSFNNKDSDVNLYTHINENLKEQRHNIREGEPSHRIEIRDDEHDIHRNVENPNLSDFHVIDTETDLEVPSGIEGPVPAVVLPPPNFIPPPNYVRAPENQNPNAQNNAAVFENFDPNSVTAANIQNDAPNLQTQNTDFSSQNFAIPPQNFPRNLLPPPKSFAPNEDFGRRGYNFRMPHRRNLRSGLGTR